MNALKELSDRLIVNCDECGDYVARWASRRNHVYQHGPSTLGFYVQTARPMATFKALRRKIPGLRVWQVGEGELIALADFADLGEAVALARAAGARRRVELSDDERQKRVERGRELQARRVERGR